MSGLGGRARTDHLECGCVKLLLDQHLSRRLADRLADVFPNSAHTSTLRMDIADYSAIWRRARADGCVLVTKKADFAAVSLRFGRPPLLVWLKVGNCDAADGDGLQLHQVDVLGVARRRPNVQLVQLRTTPKGKLFGELGVPEDGHQRLALSAICPRQTPCRPTDMVANRP